MIAGPELFPADGEKLKYSALQHLAETLKNIIEDFKPSQQIYEHDFMSNFDVSNIPQLMIAAFEDFFKLYFDQIDFFMKRNIVAAFLECSEEADVNEILGRVLHECGPGLLKTIQFLADKAKTDEIRKVLNQFKNSVKPMAKEDLEFQLNQALGNKTEYVLPDFQWYTNTTASIAEGHLSKIMVTVNNSTSIVEGFVKIMKRHTKEKIDAEAKIIKSVMSRNPQVVSILKEMLDSWYKEVDWKSEIENTMKGAEIYRIKRRDFIVNTTEILFYGNQDNPTVIAMKRAKGKTLATVLNNPEIYKNETIVCGIARFYEYFIGKWYQESMFRSKLFHGDLHGGNIMVDFNEPVAEFTIIDFGNFDETKPNFFELYYKIFFSMIIGNFEKASVLLGKNETNQDQSYWKPFEDEMEKRLTSEKLADAKNLEEIFRICIEIIGNHPLIPKPTGIVNFFRAKFLLESQYETLLENGKEIVQQKCPVKPYFQIYEQHSRPIVLSIAEVFESIKYYWRNGNSVEFLNRSKLILSKRK